MFFAFGKPWFVATAYAVNRLLEGRSSPPVHSPSVLYRLYDADGTVYSESHAMTQELADQRNRGLAEAGHTFRWMSRPPSIAVANCEALAARWLPAGWFTYRLYDVQENKFCETASTPMPKEMTDEQNKDVTNKNSPFKWIQIS